MKNIWIISLLLLAGICQDAKGQGVGDSAPDFTVDLLSGQQFTLSSHAGKVVMLFFFGNSCPYCVTSGPSVEAIYNELRDDAGFVALGLDTWNSSSSQESVAGFKSSSKVSFPLAISAGAVSTSYSTTYDRIIVIDQEGIIRHKGSTAAVNDAASAKEVITNLLTTTSARSEWSENETISIYPNPANEVAYLRVLTTHNPLVEVSLFDVSGRTVLNKHIETGIGNQEITLDIQTLKKGVYFYKIKADPGIKTGSLLIQ